MKNVKITTLLNFGSNMGALELRNFLWVLEDFFVGRKKSCLGDTEGFEKEEEVRKINHHHWNRNLVKCWSQYVDTRNPSGFTRDKCNFYGTYRILFKISQKFTNIHFLRTILYREGSCFFFFDKKLSKNTRKFPEVRYPNIGSKTWRNHNFIFYQKTA